MLVFLTWVFELVAATAIGGIVTGVTLLAGLFAWSHTTRSADISPISAPMLAGEETRRADAG